MLNCLLSSNITTTTMAPAQPEQPFPGQSEGKSHEHSRNSKVGQGMVTTVDSTATSDPYSNASSSAHNVAGNKAQHGLVQKSLPRSIWIPAGAGALGFGLSHMALKSLPPPSRLAAAGATGALAAYLAYRV